MKARTLIILMSLLMLWFLGCKKKNQIVAPGMEGTSASAPIEPSPSDAIQTQEPGLGELDALSRQLQPVFFDFDKFDIRSDQVSALQTNAGVLRNHPNVTVTLEGHCDERGTEEYNLALGERRAIAVKQYLLHLGIPESRLQTISYGESRPFAEGSNEANWSQNRRAQSVVYRIQ